MYTMAAKISGPVDTVLSPELDYHPAVFRHGAKKYTKIFQQTGGQTLSIPVTSTAESIFEIPIKAFYLPDSFIQATATPTAGGAAGRWNWFHEISHLCNEIYLYTRGGQMLCSLTNAAKYDVITQGWQVGIDEFLSADVLDRFYPSRALGDVAAVGGRHVAPIPAGAPYTEAQYLRIGGDNTATPVIPFTMRLGHFRDTIFSLKKALLLPEVILCRVVWGPAQLCQFYSTNAAVPATGHAVPAGAITLSNLSLFLSVETDRAIIADMQTRINTTGFQLPIPFVNVRRETSAAAVGSVALTVKITPDMGYMLKRLVYAPFNNTDAETRSTAMDHDNRDGRIITSYYTMLDSERRQEYQVVCTAGVYDDWNLHKGLCENTAIQSRDIYQYNWMHVEDFSSLPVSIDPDLPVPKDNLVSGIPIVGPHGSERVWTMTANLGALAYVHYTYIVTYKTLVVMPGSVMVVNAPPSA